VIKHIPGHGRATRDSHEALPVVDAQIDALRSVDFAPFAALADMPLAMTAHVVYSALDPDFPATTSRIVIREVVRELIGFDGLLISDDICMHALAGRPEDRATSALAAGCDVVLHCDGNLQEMREVAHATPPLTVEAQRRLTRARAMLTRPQPFDERAADRRLAALIGTTAMA
jgi:beta-N-acetylhexosaminidase